MSKKKALAILLFIFIGLFMFSYASPGNGINVKPLPEEEQEVEQTPVILQPVINNNYEKYPVVEKDFPAPIITVDPIRVVILLGQDYDVMTGVTVESIEELVAKSDIEDTTVLEVGSHTITYTVSDSIGNAALTTRTIVVLDPNGDEDNDGFTNEEELVNPEEPTNPEDAISPENPLIPTEPTDPEDSESHPETYAPTITLKGDNPYIMLEGDRYVEEGVTITLDPHDTVTTEEDVVITGEVNVDETGEYELTYEITDRYGKSASTTRDVVVLDPNGDEDNDGFTNEEELVNPEEPTNPEEPISPENPLVPTEPTDPMDPESHPETYPPAITLNGANPYSMLLGDEYKELGYEITLDPHDTITTKEDVVVTGEVDTDELGEYELTYEITDRYGKSADATREVVVLDPEGDEDNDGFTNEEELVDPKEPEDPSMPEGPNNPLVPTEPTDPMDPESHPETYPPTITLNGANPYPMLLGDEYKELGYEITLDPHDTITTKEDVVVTGEVDTDVLGEYELTYEITDRYGKSADATREVVVLDPLEDEDNDGYTNEEELKNGKDPLDKEDNPDYQANPTINIDSCKMEMTVYDSIPNLENCVSATDEFYGTTGVKVEIDTTDINKDKHGIYKVIVTAYDNLNNKTEKEFAFEVLKREVTIKIDDKSSAYLETIKEFTSNEDEVTVDGTDIGVTLSSNVTSTSDIGTYSITGTWTNDNYVVTFENGTYTITQKTLTEDDLENTKFEDDSFVYDGTRKKIEVTGLPTDFSVTYENNTKMDVGSREATAIITGNGNYTGTVTLNATIEITKAEITLTADDKTKVYGTLDEELTYQVTTGTIYKDDNLNVELNRKSGEIVGTYTITITASNDNYDITLENGTYTITQKTLTQSDLGNAKFEDDSFVYSATENKIEVTGLPQGFTVTYDDNTRTVVGEQKVIATITGNENYTGTVTLEALLEVTKAEVTLTADDKTKVYGTLDEELTYKVTTGEVYDNDNLNVELNRESGETVGTYTITITASNDNYDITLENGTYAITEKVITENDITWTNLEFIYNGEEQKPTATIKGIDGRDITLPVTIKNNETSINAGDYIAVVEIPDNYQVADSLKEKEFTIKPLVVDVNWDGDSFEYNGQEQMPTATYEDINGNNVSLIVTPNKESINAGEYVATASGLTNGNYELKESTLTHNYEITKKVINASDIVWGNLDITYNGEEQKPTATIGDITLDVTTDKESINAGSYTATVQAPENYEISGTATKDFEIKAKELTVSWGETTFAYDGNSHVPEASVETGIDGEEVELVVSGAKVDAGNYTATASMKTQNSNYTLTNATTNFVITKVVITADDITWGVTEFVYNGEEQKPTATLKGLGGLSINLEVTANETSINAGSYTATAQIPDNFAIEEGANEVDFTISKKQVAVEWSNTEFEYDHETHKPTATLNPSDIASGDSVIVTVSGEASASGTHTATATLNNNNYELTNPTQEFIIHNVVHITGTSTAIASGEGKEAEPGEKVEYEIILTAKDEDGEGELELSTYVIELEEGLTLDACPVSDNVTCDGNTITWKPTSIDETLNYSATVDENVKAGDILTTTIKENGEVVGTIDTKVEVTVKVSELGVTPKSKEVVLTLDVSTSMMEGTSCQEVWVDTFWGGYNETVCSSTRIDDLIKTSKDFVDNLVENNVAGSEINLTIITFGRLRDDKEGKCYDDSSFFDPYDYDYSGCHEQVYSGALTSDTVDGIKTILTGIKNEDQPGGTPIYGALERANNVLSASTRDDKYLVVLSDGDPSPSTDTNDIVGTLSASSYNIYSIGFGIDNNTTAQGVLKRIAKNNSDNYFSANDSDSLELAFNTITDEIGEDIQSTDGKVQTTATNATSITISYTENGEEKSYTITDVTNAEALAVHHITIVDGNYVWDISQYTNCKNFVMIVK